MIILAREDKDPYSIDYHAETCEEDSIWDDETLKPPEEVAARACEACMYEWRLWDSIIEETEDPMWGELAFRGFHLEQMVMEFRYPIEKLSSFDYDLMVTVHQERQRREGQLAYQRQQDARSQANKAHA